MDFICDGSDISEEEGEDAPVELVASYVLQGGLRRSTRCRIEPQRYVDDHFVELMTEDATIEDVLGPDEHCSASSEEASSEEASSEEASSEDDSEYEAGDDEEEEDSDYEMESDNADSDSS